MEKEIIKEWEYGFKGFNRDLKCIKYQYEYNPDAHVTHKHEGELRICSKGFHYCKKLEDTLKYYGNHSGNRFFIIKAKTNNIIKNGFQDDKSVTAEIELIQEIPFTDIKKFEQYIKDKRAYKDPIDIYGLNAYQEIQNAYPEAILGGSAALFLLGFNIKRNKESSDIDIVLPKYENFDISKFSKKVTEVDNMDDSKNSGNDFDYTAGININEEFKIIDVCINNKMRYKKITYRDYVYNVCPWEIIIQAKMNYANSNSNTSKKHKEDLETMFNLNSPKEEIQFINPIQNLINEYGI